MYVSTAGRVASLVKFKIITSTQPPAGHHTMGTLSQHTGEVP